MESKTDEKCKMFQVLFNLCNSEARSMIHNICVLCSQINKENFEVSETLFSAQTLVGDRALLNFIFIRKTEADSSVDSNV